MVAFAIADGAVPSNEGRGYVIRRVIRRAMRYGICTLGARTHFFSALMPAVASAFEDTYPELTTMLPDVQRVIMEEERSFASVLDCGMKHLTHYLDELKHTSSSIFPGDKLFFLYDSLGFPVDLAVSTIREHGLVPNMDKYNALMETQKKMGTDSLMVRKMRQHVQRAGDGLTYTEIILEPAMLEKLRRSGVGTTNDEFKYSAGSNDRWSLDARLKAFVTPDSVTVSADDDNDLVIPQNSVFGIILDQTNFYSESGGQISDKGAVVVHHSDGTETSFNVLDVQTYGGYVLHTCAVQASGAATLSKDWWNARWTACVDGKHRRQTAPNHTMTHVLNYALRTVLRSRVSQMDHNIS